MPVISTSAPREASRQPRELGLVRWLWAMIGIYLAGMAVVFVLLIPGRIGQGPATTAVVAFEPQPSWVAEASLASAPAAASDLPRLGAAAVQRSDRQESGSAMGPAQIDSDSASDPAAPIVQARLAAPPQVTRCWSADGTELPGHQCAAPALTAALAEELYRALDACRRAVAGEGARGVLALGVEASLDRGRTSLWLEPGADLAQSQDIIECVRLPWGANLRGIQVPQARYHIALRLVFPPESPVLVASDAAGVAKLEPSQTDATAVSATPEATTRGELVPVISQRVRVRRQPSEEGEVIGRISSPAEVVVLERQGDWCRVMTPNRNEGWMVCWTLGPAVVAP